MTDRGYEWWDGMCVTINSTKEILEVMEYLSILIVMVAIHMSTRELLCLWLSNLLSLC